MKLNNKQGDRITPIALFCIAFPAFASFYEFANVLSELLPECYFNGWILHIPIEGIWELLMLFVITACQYWFADRIAHWKGWSQPKICSGIELLVLLIVAIT
jgi:nitric oxide reductase large subunit